MELPKDRKTHLNTTAAFKVYILIIKTKGVRLYTVGLIICLKDLLIRFLILRGYISKVV